MVIEDIAKAWDDLPPGRSVVHEMHCSTEGDKRTPAGRRAVEVCYESMPSAHLADIWHKLEQWAGDNLARWPATPLMRLGRI